MEKCQALNCSGPELPYGPDSGSCFALVALALAFSYLPCIVHANTYGHMGTGSASHRILEVAGHCEAPHGLQCAPGLETALHHSLQHVGFTALKPHPIQGVHASRLPSLTWHALHMGQMPAQKHSHNICDHSVPTCSYLQKLRSVSSKTRKGKVVPPCCAYVQQQMRVALPSLLRHAGSWH